MDRSARLGTAGVGRLLAGFSIPAIVGLLAQAIYAAVDRIFLGRALGTYGIAGITVAFPYMLVLVAFGMLVGFGGAALVSIRLGEQDKNAAERVLGSAALLLIWLSLLLTLIGLVCLEPLLKLFGASSAVLPYARDYLQIIVLGTTVQVFGFGLNAIIRGEGNPRVAMLTLLIGVALNTVLAPVLIFGPDLPPHVRPGSWMHVALAPVRTFGLGWGMKGAALATILSQGVSAAWVLWYFLSGGSLLKLRWRLMHLDWPLWRAMLAIGSAPFAMQIAACAMFSLLNARLQQYGGDMAVSIWGIIHPSVMMVFMPVFGINQGVQPIIGFNYGAMRYDRVRKALRLAIAVTTYIAILGFLVMQCFPAQVFQLFQGEDASLVEQGSRAMRISVLMLPLVGFQGVSSIYFLAVGKPKQAMLLMLSRQVLLLIPAIAILPCFFGLDGVWAAMPTADLGSSIITGVYLVRELRHLQDRHAQSRLVPGVPPQAIEAVTTDDIPADIPKPGVV
jgi:Na+-driven multidrug efflux pump